jgi:hypothetical protein
MDLTTQQLLGASLTWFEKNNFAGYYFIGDDSASSRDALAFVKAKYANLIPEIGSTQLEVGRNNTASITSLVNVIISSQRQRVGIISTFPGNDPTTTDIFDGLRRLAPIRYRVLSTNVNEKQLTANMVGHFSVSSYFQSIIIPENSVFVSSYKAKYGQEIITSDMVQSYNSILVWGTASTRANSFNPTRTRVHLYDSTFSSPAGSITVTKSNRVAAPYRVAQVIRAGPSLFYRPIVGLDDTTNLVQQPALQVEGDACFFGALRKVEPQTTPLRVITASLAIFSQCVLVFFMGWVTYHRKKLVIRHTGYDFLMLNLTGSFVNLCYVYFVYTYEMNPFLCQARNFASYIGFYLMFGTLIHKCFAIFDATRKKSITSKTTKIKTSQIVSGFFIVILIALVVKSVVERDLVFDQVKILEDGVLYEKYTVCRTTFFDLGLVFSCVLICIIGCVLAVQIRNVNLPFNESFHMGSAVYSWTFTKIVLEVVKQFAPYNHEIYFLMDTWGRIE